MRSSIYHGARELCQDIEMSFCDVEKIPETGKILRNISLVRLKSTEEARIKNGGIRIV